MGKPNKLIETIDSSIKLSVKNGLVYLGTEDQTYNGRHIHVNGKKMLNFGSCSYLGLELDERLKNGAKEAIDNFGTQFSASRAFISCSLYEEAEKLLSELFDAYFLITTTTTIAHQIALPVVVEDGDLVIIDIQAHASLYMATSALKTRGIPVEIIPHSDMESLEKKIELNKNKYDKIWYLSDGVYSMYGDKTPLQKITQLLEKYDGFHVYFDDAHGGSWTGKHGRGSVLGRMPIHQKMIVTVSLNKSFAAGGGGIIFPNSELRRKVRHCGGPMIFSGPMQPPMLGTLIASAKIHLTEEIHEMQRELADKIHYFNDLCNSFELPLIAHNDVPIRYIGLGLTRVTYNMGKRLMNDGFYMNFGLFPAVSMKRSGLRCAINRHLTKDDIFSLVERIAYHLPRVFEEEERALKDIKNFFPGYVPDAFLNRLKKEIHIVETPKDFIKVEYKNSIDSLNADEWDALFHDKGSFTSDGLIALEHTFQDQEKKENNWEFHYFIIRDQDDHIILATFFTEALWKDDMLAPREVSFTIEKERLKDPYYLTSKVLMMGSLLTEGEHLYIDREHPLWKKALTSVLDKVQSIQKSKGINSLALRDFDSDDKELEAFFVGHGLVKLDMSNTHKLSINWSNNEEYLSILSRKRRRQIRTEVLRNEDLFEVQVLTSTNKISQSMNKKLYKMYLDVAKQGLEINTFVLPENIWMNLAESKSWEIMLLRLKSTGKIVSCIACFKTKTSYFPMFMGLDYDHVVSKGSYRQSLWQIVMRAQKLSKKQVFFGFGAATEKLKLGSQASPVCSYIQVDNTFQASLIDNMVVQKDNNPKAWKKKVKVKTTK